MRNALVPSRGDEAHVALIPKQFAHTGLSILQILAIARTYWKQSLMIAIGILCLAFVAIKSLPKSYSATVTLIVNSDTKDPLAGRDFPVDMLSSYVATQTELILSPVVLLGVVDRLKLTEDTEFSRNYRGSPAELRQYVESILNSKILVETGRGGQLLYVSVSSKNAEKAAAIANAVAAVYIDHAQQRLNDPAGERAKRYSEDLAQLRDKVAQAQDTVTAFRKAHALREIDASNADNEVQTLDNLQLRLVETQNNRRVMEAKLVAQQSPAGDAIESAALQQLKTQLATQLSQLAQLSAVMGPQHPKVLEINSQIGMTRQLIAAQQRELVDGLKADLARTKDLEQQFSRAVADQQVKVLSLRQSQDEGSKLLLELESAKNVYKHALDGYDQIMFAAVANHTDVGVINRAVPPVKADKPNKLKLMAMAFVGAILAGFCGPFAYGLLFNRRIRCRDDIERDLGIAVLGRLSSLPAFPGAL
jgi:polysaccharide biosynthesis transport protein